MRKFAVIILALCLLLAGCGKDTAPQDTAPEETQVTVGLSFPGEPGSDWVLQGEALAQALTEAGFAVKQTYAEHDPQLQNDQIEKLLVQGVDCLVVMAVDSLALTPCLDRAEETGVPVVAYQRLLMNTHTVDYYVAYDYQAAGRQIGEHIARQKQLPAAGEEKREYTVEFLMGSPEDNSALLMYHGVMSVLRPYLDSGVLVSRTERVAFEDTCVQNWSVSGAREYFWDHIYNAYGGLAPDIICTTGDTLAEGICAGLEAAGCQTEKWPLVTGQGGDAGAMERIKQGAQSITLQGDPALLHKACIQGLQALLADQQPKANDESCHNGAKTVAAWLCPMTSCEKELSPEG